MNRKEFLEKLGLGAAFALTATCGGGCSSDNAGEDADVDFTLDLDDAANADLLQDGGYIFNGNVVIARNNDGAYVAATKVCSHEQLTQVIFQNNIWYCTAHAAEFDQTGEGLNANGSDGLTIYNTELSGNMLRIFS